MPDTAQAILAAAVTALGTRVPTRQYVAAGLVAYDQCEQLTVTWAIGGTYLVNPFPNRQPGPGRCASVLAADYLVECTRCVPVITGDQAPTPADLTASGIEIMTDAVTLYCALIADAPTLFGTHPYAFGAVTPYGPSGAVGGTRIPITVQIDCST